VTRNKHAVWMAKARVIATLATCCRKQVGCVIVSADGHERVSGYNGSLPGQPHCTDEGVGCWMHEGHCVRTVHSESNAIAQAARDGVSVKGGTAYVTAIPCLTCFKLLAAAGVVRVFYGELYGDSPVNELAPAVGVELIDGSDLPRLGLSL